MKLRIYYEGKMLDSDVLLMSSPVECVSMLEHVIKGSEWSIRYWYINKVQLAEFDMLVLT